MNDNFTKLLQNSSQEEIIKVLEDKLKIVKNPIFGKKKIIPFTEAILSRSITTFKRTKYPI